MKHILIAAMICLTAAPTIAGNEGFMKAYEAAIKAGKKCESAWFEKSMRRARSDLTVAYTEMARQLLETRIFSPANLDRRREVQILFIKCAQRF